MPKPEPGDILSRFRPRAGLCVPVRYRRCRDGDTIEVSLAFSDYVWAVRLSECWCKELDTTEGEKAKAFSESVLDNCDQIYVFVPYSSTVNLLSLLSFDRLIGEVWVTNDKTLNQMLVDAGLATRTKLR